jgi:hypothetical protein
LGSGKRIVQNLGFLMLEAALVPRKCGLSFFIVLIILTFAFHFMLVSDQNPVPNSVPEPECISATYGSAPPRQKVTVPAVPDQVPNTGKMYQDNVKKSPEKALSRCAVRPV